MRNAFKTTQEFCHDIHSSDNIEYMYIAHENVFISHIHIRSFFSVFLSIGSFIRRLDLCAHALIFFILLLLLRCCFFFYFWLNFICLCYGIVLWNLRENIIVTFTTHTTSQSMDGDHDWVPGVVQPKYWIENYYHRLEKAPVCSIETGNCLKKFLFISKSTITLNAPQISDHAPHTELVKVI